MKPQIALLLGICGAAPLAHAQNAAPDGLKFPPRQSPFGTAPDGTLRVHPDLPPLPNLNPAQVAGLKIRILPTANGEIYQAEIVRQSVAEVLEALAAAAGVTVVVDRRLDRQTIRTGVFRGHTALELLELFGTSQAKMQKLPSGLYIFSQRPKLLSETLKSEKPVQIFPRETPDSKFAPAPDNDPFVIPRGEKPFSAPLDPAFNFGERRSGPQPNWQKREFNGREYFHVPLPSAEQPNNTEKQK